MKNAAKILFEYKVEIIEKWEQKVQLEIEASHHTQALILRNQLPHFLEEIIYLLNTYKDYEDLNNHNGFKKLVEQSIDHGRHRATTSYYTISGILEEYIAFHQVLTDTLMEHNVYNTTTTIVLKYAIETAMTQSASAFNNSINEMKEKLVSTLAHDIRNPISAAYIALNMLEPELNILEVSKAKKIVTNSLDYALRLIEGLLDTVAVEAGEGIFLNFKEHNLYEDLEWVIKETRMIFPNEIILESNTTTLQGVFDPTAVRRILENLITNAAKYGAPEKPITIKVENNSSMIYIGIHNFGNPISSDKQKEIFNYLYSEKNQKKCSLRSWGMGLSLIRAVTEAHGGNVTLESSEPTGTTFTINLDKYKNKPGKVKSHIKYLIRPEVTD